MKHINEYLIGGDRTGSSRNLRISKNLTIQEAIADNLDLYIVRLFEDSFIAVNHKHDSYNRKYLRGFSIPKKINKTESISEDKNSMWFANYNDAVDFYKERYNDLSEIIYYENQSVVGQIISTESYLKIIEQ